MYGSFVKPTFDFAASLCLIVVLSPLLLVIIFLLALSQKGRVWFVQERPGLSGKPFRLIKFRSMSDALDAGGNLLPDERRLTTVGKWVRRLSLDELPQLFNVLKGDMSIVGPRPWLMEYLPMYNEYQRRRLNVRPGITGWAQVNGRNTADWGLRFELDIWYVDHQSFLLDLRILAMTVIKVLKAEGISGASSATMEKWSGN